MTVRPRKAAHNEDDSRHGAPPENTFSSLGFEDRHKHYLSRLSVNFQRFSTPYPEVA